MSRDHAREGADRGRASSRHARQVSSIHASLLAGPDVAVLNVSRGGLLIESSVRLRPGAGICLNVVLDGDTHRVDGQVTHVDATLVDNRVVYRAGVIFDEARSPFAVAAGAQGAPDTIVPPPPPLTVTPVDDEREAREREVQRLREQQRVDQRQREQQASTIAALREALESGEQLRRELIEAHASERARWTDEQQELLDRVREAEEQASAMMQDMRAARDAARRVSREHAAEIASRDAHVRERDQQIAALRAEHAALLESVSAQLEAFEHRDADRAAQQGRLADQLSSAEAWCADQQDLLYRVRQQMNAVFALLQGGDEPLPAALPPSGLPLDARSLRQGAVIRALPSRRDTE